ncbi:MAG: S-layer homology domain-containing protein, partial [Anaerolineales bacterium]|nr:S-layer homology domain-containing protein [Anaerolineales bacterium]
MKDKNSTLLLKLILITLFIVALFLPNNSLQAQGTSETLQVDGWISIQWGDGLPGSSNALQRTINLTEANGNSRRLDVSDEQLYLAGGPMNLDRQYVRVEIKTAPLSSEKGLPAIYEVVSLSHMIEPTKSSQSGISAAVGGSQPWVSIMCKFSDQTAEPKPLSYFQNMFGSEYPGLDHFWRELSYNQINIYGSTATGWYTLPNPRSHYLQFGILDFGRAAEDCTAVADPYVNFPAFVGINLMFNYELDGYAWGGSWCLDRDGVFRCWNMTWEPPWGYEDITVIGHEMGHGFGLPHSSGMYEYTYDNRWDVMSDTWSDCFRSTDAVFGCLGQHTIAFHKDVLGWIPDFKKYVVPFGNGTPQSNSTNASYLMAEIRLSTYGDDLPQTPDFFTVEVRDNYGYDVKLPGQGVIIHEVNTWRERPANVVDVDYDYNTGDDGAMWVETETYINPTYPFNVAVLAKSGKKYQVRITNGSQIATLWLEPLARDVGKFSDVTPFHWAFDPIAKLYNSGISSGCTTSPLQYCPEDIVTRAQMAVFLEKGI